MIRVYDKYGDLKTSINDSTPINVDVTNTGEINSANSTTTPLASSGVFTGTTVNVVKYPSIIVTCLTDQQGTLQAQFSPDGTNWDSTLTYQVGANINEVHKLTVTRAYFRVVLTNTSGSSQSYLRLQTLLGSQSNLVSAINAQVQLDADAQVVRNIGAEYIIPQNLLQGYTIAVKNGRNPDIDTGSVPEDIWGGSGVYTGFPTGSPEKLSIVSTSASDTGTLTVSGLRTNLSTSITSETITLNGLTPVLSTNTWYRIHTAVYNSGSSTTFNVGTITVNHEVTTTNVFLSIIPGTSQSNSSGFTIPAQANGYIQRLHGAIRGGASASIDCSLWTRTLNGSPRLRKPFTVVSSSTYDEDINGFINFSAGTDIIVRCTASSANNIEVVTGYDIVIISNALTQIT